MPSTRDKKAIICDGAVRSGKTIMMIMGFVFWAMRFFDNKNFAICGKTVGTVERNIISPLMELEDVKCLYKIDYSVSKKMLTISDGKKTNKFYVFGGKDESSYMLIQGVTLSGVLFDEVALQVKSFVEQAIARTLSEKDAKLWFNCNPDNPYHWFKSEWLDDADNENKKNSIHLHFLMKDNPILTDELIKDAESMYDGVFKDRYILGLWVAAEGLVYPMFDKKEHMVKTDDYIYFDYWGEKRLKSGKWYLSIDYGTFNPFSCGLWYVPNDDNRAYRVDEIYYDGRKDGSQKTDEEYLDMVKRLIGDKKIEQIIIDPSAASMITLFRKKGYPIIKAKNDVIDGIRYASMLLKEGKLLFDNKCKNIEKEFQSYLWDEKRAETAGVDKVVKEHDHALDEMRYFCYTILRYDKRFNKSQIGKNKAVMPEITTEDMMGEWE